jgi:hypothetical protein
LVAVRAEVPDSFLEFVQIPLVAASQSKIAHSEVSTTALELAVSIKVVALQNYFVPLHIISEAFTDSSSTSALQAVVPA